MSGLVLLVALLWPRGASAADCTVSRYHPVARTREAALLEAGVLAATGHYSDARAVYLWVLARSQRDAEALFGIARVDSWGGCFALAEHEYQQVVGSHPEDSDVRAGYIDLLVWSRRLDEAERTLEVGLALEPSSASLLVRAARFAYWRGNATKAVDLADRAERAAPDDGDVRALRDRLFLVEGRVTAHVDAYPPGYQSLYSLAAQALARTGRFEIYGGAQALARYAGASAGSLVVDGRYPLGVIYHPALGTALGAEVAVGAPAVAVPVLSLKASVLAPVYGPVDGSFAYLYWHYAAGQVVHIFNPSVGIDLPHEFRLDLRAWISAVSLPEQGTTPGRSLVEPAVGAQLTYEATPRLTTGITYTYGAEVDQVPSLYALVTYRAHMGTAFADWLIARNGGVRPMVGTEYRLPMNIAIWSFEVSGYGRW